ncbi:MAG: AsmA family protein [Cytophagales bacterium]|nr:AsmA family protein [Cytophagales bacterium]
MNKVVKLILKIIGGLIGLILLGAILIPIIYKNDIKNAIDVEIAKNLNATVFYDVDEFGVSLFRSFPNVSIQMGDFGIIGEGVFEEDTLMSVKNFELTIDLMSLLDEITINKIQLDEPKILIMVLEDGTANYDIAAPTEDVDEEPVEEGSEETEPLSIKINRWEINHADVVYYDQSMDFYTTLGDLNHSGSGDFSADVFQMITNTNIDDFSLGYEGTEYLSNKSVYADVTMNMDLANMTFTFDENRVAVNDFAMAFDGIIGMPSDDINLDITFSGKEIDMKSVLSLIPGAYEEYLDGIEASGEINFDGIVKGVYNDNSMPQVKTNLQINDGKVSAPDLPQPLEKIQLGFSLDYPSADMTKTSVTIDYSSILAEQKATVTLDFENLEDYQWDLSFVGELDLEKLSQILPLDSTTLQGNIIASLQTAGKMSDIEAENWGNLPTSGQLNIKDFYFENNDLPQGFGMSNVEAEFDPEKIEVKTFAANAGKTDLNINGILTNYLPFAIAENEKLLGTLNFSSKKVDLNEWMTTDEVSLEEEAPADTTSLEVVRIPQNIDLTLSSNVDELLYDNLTLEDFKGNILVKNGAVILDGAGFNLLGGSFTMDGSYASVPEQPTFDFDFGIKELSIPESFKAFIPIQKLVPVANKMTGSFSTNFAASGVLGSDMMPLMNSLSGSGLVEIADATLKNVKALDGVTKLANIKSRDSEQLAKLKDLMLSMKIEEGRLSVKPFDMTIGGNETVISGSTGIDGSLDYAMAMKVPSGAVGQAVNQALAKIPGVSSLASEFLNLNIGISGTYDDPKIKLLSAKPDGGEGSLTASVKAQVKEKVDKKVAETKEKVDKKVTEVKKKAKEQVTEKVDTAKAVVEEKVKETKEEVTKKAEEKAKDKVTNLFKKKKKKKKSGN